jgi:hypothetical protein
MKSDKAQIIELKSVLKLLCNSVKDELWGLEDCPELLEAYQKAQNLLNENVLTRCFQCNKFWETECECPMPDPMCDPDGYAEHIARDRRRNKLRQREIR